MRSICLFLWVLVSIVGCGNTSLQQEAKADRGRANYNMAPAQLGYAGEAPKESWDAVSSHEASNTEDYKNYGINPRVETQKDKLSTFAIDVDTASYTIARRKLNEGSIPPKDSVRVEEFINYFPPEYPRNRADWFKVHLDASPSPFRDTTMLRVVVQGKDILPEERQAANLVFLIDTSGSMMSSDKMDLVKQSLRILVEALDNRDRVAICTYAGSVTTVLEPTSIREKSSILEAIENLSAGGSTAMASGIVNAYRLANANFQVGAVNRVIVCSDGDANVGATSHEDILKMIEDFKDKGITLSTVGFGMGNYKDTMMEQLANKGNGNYAYVDSVSEAKRVFVEQMTGTLQVIAKDMKIQVEFNPETVKTYRLIGYENREVKDEDFRKDQVDGGEVGSNHTVTALYELELHPQEGSLCTVFVRAKKPEGSAAEELRFSFEKKQIVSNWESASQKFRFVVCVAEFAELLRESEYATSTVDKVLEQIEKMSDTSDEKEKEFLSLVKKLIALKG